MNFMVRTIALASCLAVGPLVAHAQSIGGDTSSPGWRVAPPASIQPQSRYSAVDLAYQLRPAKTPRYRVVVEPGADAADIRYQPAATRVDALGTSLASAGLTARFEGDTLTIARSSSLPQRPIAIPNLPSGNPNAAALGSGPLLGAGGVAQQPSAPSLPAPTALPPLQPLPQVALPNPFANTAPAQPQPPIQQAAPAIPAPIGSAVPPTSISPQAVLPPPQQVQSAASVWSLELSDITIANAFQRWARTSGYKIKWDAARNILVGAPDQVDGTFEQAVAKVLASPGIRNGEYPLEVCFYPNTPKLARITRRGEQEKECQ